MRDSRSWETRQLIFANKRTAHLPGDVGSNFDWAVTTGVVSSRLNIGLRRYLALPGRLVNDADPIPILCRSWTIA